MNEKAIKKIIGDLESLICNLKELTDEKEKPKEELEPKVSLEDVRAYLAVLSQKGKTAEVKALILKFGANKLSEVDESKYAELLKEAEGIQVD